MADIEEYICEKCNNEAQGTTCRHCGYMKDDGISIYELRVKKKMVD